MGSLYLCIETAADKVIDGSLGYCTLRVSIPEVSHLRDAYV